MATVTASPRQALPPLDLALALAACGDDALRREVTTAVLEGLPAERAALSAAVDGRDSPALARIAHRLKSSLAAVGAAPASAAAGALDVEARRAGPAVPELALLLDAELERAAIALAGSLGDGTAA